MEVELDLQKFCGLGSDGATVMLGVRGGVLTLLKQKTPFLAVNHCIAHRLPLACSQAANSNPYLKRFKESTSLWHPCTCYLTFYPHWLICLVLFKERTSSLLL